LYFLHILEIFLISGNLKEIKTWKHSRTVLDRHFSLEPGTDGLAQWPFRPGRPKPTMWRAGVVTTYGTRALGGAVVRSLATLWCPTGN
jgi:hypothetical protein